MGFNVLIEVTEVCKGFSAVGKWTNMGSDLEVNDLMVSLERVCLFVSKARINEGRWVGLQL
jgi:hypothetical protein